jgi:hypothetical protein
MKLGRAEFSSLVLALVAVASVLAVLATRHTPTTTERDARAKNLLPVWREDEVRRVELRRDGSLLRLERTADGFSVFTPDPEPADDAATQKFVSGIGFLTPVRRLEGNDVHAHGLDRPRATLKLEMGERKLGLVLGDDAPAPAGGAYVALDGAGSSRIGAVVSAEAAKLFATRADDLRRTALVSLGERDLKKLVLERPTGKLTLTHAEALGFRLDGGERANRDACAPLFSALTRLTATRFLTLAAAETARAGAAFTRVTLVPRDDGAAKEELELGGACPGAPEEIVAIVRAPHVRAACVHADVLAPLSIEAAALDDHYPFSARKDEVEALTIERDGKKLVLERQGTSFLLRAPAEANVPLDAGNGRVDGVVRAQTEPVAHPDPKSLGFEPPHGLVVVRVIGDDDKAHEERVELGKTAADGTLYLRRTDDGRVLALGREAARAFVVDTTLLRSSKVLDFALSSLVELELSAPEHQLVRRVSSGFELALPPGFEDDGELTTDAVLALGSLTALRFVADADDGSFGLATPTLTARARLDASDAGANERVLSVGRATPGGYFAALAGSPGVFVIERGVVERLGTLLVSRAEFMAEPSTLARLTLRTPKKQIVLERRGGELVAKSGDVPPAAIARALEALAGLRAEAALHSGPARATEGFSAPALTLELEPSPGLGKPRIFRFGGTGTYRDEVVRHARAEGVDATFAITDAKLAPFFDLF